MNKKTVRDVDVSGKRVFLRADLNVPIDDGRITDDSRIRASLPTLVYLLEQGGCGALYYVKICPKPSWIGSPPF